MSVMDRFTLDGRIAIVTGASSGLGVAFAKGLAEAGASVALVGRRVERLQETAALVESVGGSALVVPADVSDPAQCQSVVDQTIERFGALHILVNNAGIGTAVPATRETPEEFRKVIDLNLNGTYWMAQSAARVMQPGSTIVNIGSVLGITTGGLPQAAYSASKAAVMGLTRDLAQQWATRKGIRVNAIAPGFFHTEMTEQYPDGYIEAMGWRMLLGRMGDPEELTATLIWLASDASGYVTGQTVVVDGGVSIT